MLRVLIGYESSGIVRQAFRVSGHDAWSCDLQAADDGSFRRSMGAHQRPETLNQERNN